WKVALALFTTESPRSPASRTTFPSVTSVLSGDGPPTVIPFWALPGTLCCTTFSAATTWPPSVLRMPPFRLSCRQLRSIVAKPPKSTLTPLSAAPVIRLSTITLSPGPWSSGCPASESTLRASPHVGPTTSECSILLRRAFEPVIATVSTWQSGFVVGQSGFAGSGQFGLVGSGHVGCAGAYGHVGCAEFCCVRLPSKRRPRNTLSLP